MANLWGNNWNSDWLCFLGLQITADGDCSHEIKRCLLLGRKAMTNLDSILKSRHYFTNKGPSNQSYGFSSSHVWMWELDSKESWTPKNWCFWTVVLEKTLESPLDCRRSNQSILKEISPGFLWREWCWCWNSSTLATSCEELTHWKRLWCWEGLGAGGEGDDRGWDVWMASPPQWTCLSELRELVMGREAWRACDSWCGKESDMTEQLNWTELRHKIASGNYWVLPTSCFSHFIQDTSWILWGVGIILMTRII